MSQRFHGYGLSPNGTNYTARIYDVDYVGASSEIDFQQGGIRVVWDSKETDNRHASMQGSTCELSLLIVVGNTTQEDFINEVRTEKEGKFWVELVSGGGSTVRWRGILVSDVSNEVDEATRFRCKISAVCGLALLKDIPYHSGTAIYTGPSRLVQHLTRALSKLSHAALWGASDGFLETSTDWWAETMATGGSNDALYKAYVDSAAFYDYKTKGGIDDDVLSCYDVVSQIARSFGARVKQQDGYFRLEQIDYRINSTYTYRRYDKSGNFVSTSAHTGVTTVNQTAINAAKISYVEYDYLPQISKAKVTYNCFLRRNFWQGIVLSDATTYNFDVDINSNSGATTLNLSIPQFTVSVKNNSYSGNAADVLFAELRLKLKVGTKFLKRTGTYSNFSYHPTAAEWTASSSDTVNIVVPIGQVPASGVTSSGIVGFQMITPPLLEDGSTNSVSVSFFQLKRNNNEDVTESEFTISWTAQSLWMSTYDSGTPDVGEDQIEYETVNPDGGTYFWKEDIRLGGSSPNYLGRLTDGAGYAYQNWAQGTDTPNRALGALLSKVVTDGQLRPTKRLNGTIYGESIDPRKLLSTSEGIEWLYMRMEWSPLESTITGSWVEMDYGTAGVPSTPIKIKILTGGDSKVPVVAGPVISFPTGNGSQGFSSNSPGIVIAPIAYNFLDGAITKGATVTTIPILTASTGDEFLAGDGVTLAHPITGQYQTFEIATAPGVGATSLSVTSATAEFSAPEGSFLVVKQKAFAFSLPNGTHEGSILRWDDVAEVWEPYDGSTDGHVLTWDTTNGWQAEAGGGVADGDKGDITVSGGGTIWTIDTNVVTLAKFQQIATDSFVGRDTAGTGNIEVLSVATVKTLLNLSGTNSGDQTITLTGDVTGSGTGSFPATIAANAVTLAKMATVATARFFGRVTAGTGNVEAMTGAQATTLLDIFTSVLKGLVPASGGGTINFMRADGTWNVPAGTFAGSLASTQVAYGSAANTIAGSARFTWDNTNGRLTIIPQVAGLGAGLAGLNVNPISMSSMEALRMWGNVAGNMLVVLHNTNTAATSNALFQIISGSAAAGNPILQFTVSGQATTALGLHNSDGDKFKITNDVLPGGVANAGIILTRDSPPRVGINRDAPTYTLDSNGVTRATHYITTGNVWSAANHAFGAGAGTTPTLNGLTGGHNGFLYEFTTGTAPTNNGIIGTLTFPTAFPAAGGVRAVFSARGTSAATDISKFYISTVSDTQLVFRANGTLTASTAYQFQFILMGYA